MRGYSRRLLLACSTALASLSAPAVAAEADQAAANSGQAESEQGVGDIVVTARRSTERLLDVPVQVNVVSGESLARANATDISKISENIPFVTVNQSSSGNGGGFVIRGIGTTATDVGIKQTVLMNMDNVFLARGRMIPLGMFDISQVEVLKGPQALFYGKNSPAGVVSISTVDPGSALTGFVRGSYEFNARERTVEGAVSIPLTDNLSVRLAGRINKMDGYLVNDAVGYAVNPYFGTNANGTGAPGTGYTNAFGNLNLPVPGAIHPRGPVDSNQGGRITVVWKPTPELSFKGKYSRLHYHRDGGSDTGISESVCVNGATTPVSIGVPMTHTNCKGDQHNLLSGVPPLLATNMPGANGGIPYITTDAQIASLEIGYTTDHLDVSLISGYYDLNYAGSGNSYFNDLGANLTSNSEDAWGFSQEARITTKFDMPINFVVGGYYSKQHQTNISNSLQTFQAQDPATGRYYNYTRDINQGTETFSLFGQARWKILDTLEFDAGARWTAENNSDHSGNSWRHPLVTSVYPAGQYFDRSKYYYNVSPEATLTWHPSQNQTIYGAYKTGYKSGGFSAPPVFSSIFTPENTEFAPEKTRGFEIGYKAQLLDRKLRVEATAYRYKITNQQVSALVEVNGVFTFLVANAASSLQQGVEGSLSYQVTPDLSFDAAIGYNDTHYKSFPNATCYTGQATIGTGCVTPVGSAAGVQDLSGKTLPRSPKWAGSFGFTYEKELGSSFKGRLGANAIYTGGQNVTDGLDPRMFVKGYWRVNTSVAVSTSDDKYELALNVRNLTDAYKAWYALDFPRQPSEGQYNAYFNRPREISLQLTARF
ncbi:TonB-dependent receptor [Sphingobium sp. V4]|uniref:TonB-dependent receptor n=1 Tax=Sphingobium sp. V4 TaxID=3038927 RepID=UPI00255834B6|nr:TonB-dependent receptor [Sphingobium sp. V4]WIW89512.1 TonB-dependent receptor [Sphingobium sp. V4]